MGLPSDESLKITAVAVDKDKNSSHAVRWAVDNLADNTDGFILIHVKPNNTFLPQGSGATGLSDADIKHMLMSFKGYGAPKMVTMTEVILQENDVERALQEYIANNFISNFVIGASKRNGFARMLKGHDITSTLLKSAPDFCTVYVISKGKISTVRKAQRSAASTPPRLPSPRAHTPKKSSTPPRAQSPIRTAVHTPQPRVPSPIGTLPRQQLQGPNSYDQNELIAYTRAQLAKKHPAHIITKARERHKSHGEFSIDSVDSSSHSHISSFSRDSFISESGTSAPVSFGSMDSDQFSYLSQSSGSPKKQSVVSSDPEAEMKRLRLEIKQAMDLYSKACQEAISSQHMTNELNQWKFEEGSKMEELEIAKIAALSLAENEKTKFRAVMECAKVAHTISEKEKQRRGHAELIPRWDLETNRAQSYVRYRKYSIDDIEAGTEKFADKSRIGEGGYGPVFKGVLDHTHVAIKILRPDAAQGRQQFNQEVDILSSIRHPNLVLLLGACPEYGCLVYEYMSNGSLEDRLFRRDKTRTLSWRQRFSIAAEIATALLFLHQTKPEPIVHRDLKPGNILLDRNYVSKISDVGLSRLVPSEVADCVTRYRMTAAAGTFSYIDPEYQQTAILTTKSDIYSLGVVLLQMITGKPPMGLTHCVEMSIERGNFEEILDPSVPDWPVEEALVLAKIALKCTELRKRDRPDLGRVVMPELNRLRDLGISYEPEIPCIYPSDYAYTNNNSHSNSHAASSPGSSFHSRISYGSQDSRSTSS